jgi:hypothetical protein
MRFKYLALVCIILITASFMVGCASVGGGQISGVNWASAKNGGRVSAFSEESEHPASTLINGVTSAEGWDQGEGWQAQITAAQTKTVREQRDEMEKNWVEVELSQPVVVNEVRVYTVDSQKYPALKFGVGDILVQYQMTTASKDLLWANVKRPGKGLGDQNDVIKGNTKGVINVRFEPVNTQKIRVLIYSTNDLKMGEDGKTKEGNIRLTEIEVYGSGKQKARNEIDDLFQNK